MNNALITDAQRAMRAWLGGSSFDPALGRRRTPLQTRREATRAP